MPASHSATRGLDLLVWANLTDKTALYMRKSYAYYIDFESALRKRASRQCLAPCDWRALISSGHHQPREAVYVMPHTHTSRTELLNSSLDHAVQELVTAAAYMLSLVYHYTRRWFA
jgi:hypothetical protein